VLRNTGKEVITMSISRHTLSRSFIALAVLFVTAGAAHAGPPLICHAFDAGKAPLLPWSTSASNWNAPDSSYDVQRLTADTLKLLSPDAPILARMENMRRATIYATRDPKIAAELMVAVMGRALTEASQGARDSLAWFDAGYLIESYRQASFIHKWDMFDSAAQKSAWTIRSEPRGVDGYTFVQKALALAGSNPEMEYAASLMRAGNASAEHLKRAVAGAPAGSLLAKNIAR
jgi:hypothetical protein